ncbi:hypothetical protein WJX73_003014 [Symbiochloris irregularis]|uniref:Expansin-like EG45 domain-containing protein n=1 Tax=Symbiochloris irregularis TaxID=706552 RepID=A0AAW1NQL4_9CHLO
MYLGFNFETGFSDQGGKDGALADARGLTTNGQEALQGRATFYGHDDYTLNDGSCACHKRGGLYNPCSSQFCFDYIGEKQPNRGVGLVAAVNTPGIQNTDQCGACYEIRCVDGPTRGPDSTERPDSACVFNTTITVMITDSCPCNHKNPSNQKWCCGDMQHFDLSYSAFGSIARQEAGVIDVQYVRVPSARCQYDQRTGVNFDTCKAYYGVYTVSDMWWLLGVIGCSFAGSAVVCFMIIKALYW